jgi:hypothetical protein
MNNYSASAVEELAGQFERFPESAVMGVTVDLQPFYYAMTEDFRSTAMQLGFRT